MSLQVLSGIRFLSLLASSDVFTLLDLPDIPLLFLSLLHDLTNSLDTDDTLATTLITLDQADGHIQVHVNFEDVAHQLYHCIRLFHLKSFLVGFLD